MITIKSLDKSHSTDVIKILIDSFSKNYDKKINESIFSSDEVDGIVALEKGNVIGYASIHYIKKITRKSGIIEDVVVKENLRGKGIGKLLVNNLIEKAKKNNCDKIILSSSEKNLKFYQKLGFQKNEFEMIMRI
ncbi:MAG: GNAT family N-acetyltransferase [Flavobacteriaceae bacterium]|mgnify:FL=1|nr:GNAT family N-acetyltransferase [Flavobacteriaceae bacterium]|tara:strand:- start:1326 stop:1727 length:402 start_codon:yes stop_codon:yes gene_type:complete